MATSPQLKVYTHKNGCKQMHSYTTVNNWKAEVESTAQPTTMHQVVSKQ